jgi:anti-sigma B factor antagonist
VIDMSIDNSVRLEGALTIAAGQAQHERLLAAVQDCDALLRIDLSDVDAFDTAGVQLLLAARRTMEMRGGRLQVEAASVAVQEVLAVFGLEVLLRPAAQP